MTLKETADSAFQTQINYNDYIEGAGFLPLGEVYRLHAVVFCMTVPEAKSPFTLVVPADKNDTRVRIVSPDQSSFVFDQTIVPGTAKLAAVTIYKDGKFDGMYPVLDHDAEDQMISKFINWTMEKCPEGRMVELHDRIAKTQIYLQEAIEDRSRALEEERQDRGLDWTL